MKNVVLYLGLGSLFAHELDAMPNHEWRVLPLVRILPDDMGMVVFVAAHVPLFALLIAMVASSNDRTRALSGIGISAFLVIHALLHALFMSHPNYEFSSILSNALIFGGAAFGAVYLILTSRNKYAGAT